jgi:hypothetical protein
MRAGCASLSGWDLRLAFRIMRVGAELYFKISFTAVVVIDLPQFSSDVNTYSNFPNFVILLLFAHPQVASQTFYLNLSFGYEISLTADFR